MSVPESAGPNNEDLLDIVTFDNIITPVHFNATKKKEILQQLKVKKYYFGYISHIVVLYL